MKLWWAQLALNVLRTPVLFGTHQIGFPLSSSPSASTFDSAMSFGADCVPQWLRQPRASHGNTEAELEVPQHVPQIVCLVGTALHMSRAPVAASQSVRITASTRLPCTTVATIR
jgi:hypothetical protein